MTKAKDLERELALFEDYISQDDLTAPGILPEVDAFEEYIKNGKTEKGN